GAARHPDRLGAVRAARRISGRADCRRGPGHYGARAAGRRLVPGPGARDVDRTDSRAEWPPEPHMILGGGTSHATTTYANLGDGARRARPARPGRVLRPAARVERGPE